VDDHDGVAKIVFAGEQHFRLEFLDVGGELIHLLPDLVPDVLSLAREFEQRVEIGDGHRDPRLVGQRLFEPLALL